MNAQQWQAVKADAAEHAALKAERRAKYEPSEKTQRWSTDAWARLKADPERYEASKRARTERYRRARQAACNS